jgi:hypothetical protein
VDLPRFRGELRFVPPAEPFFRPDPHGNAAAARSDGQGSPQATAEATAIA